MADPFIKGNVSCSNSDWLQPAFSEAIVWREYAGYLETELAKMGKGFVPIANNVTRTYPPRAIQTTVYE